MAIEKVFSCEIVQLIDVPTHMQMLELPQIEILESVKITLVGDFSALKWKRVICIKVFWDRNCLITILVFFSLDVR